MTFLFSNVILDAACFTNPDVTHTTYCRNIISNKRTATPGFVALWPVLPFRERKNFIQFGAKNILFRNFQLNIMIIFFSKFEAVTSGECEEQPQCITQHPGFHPVCINRWVLQVAWYQYKQQYKAAYDGWEDKLFRHIAYRQLTRWCWGILGKEIRVVLPACAVMCTRNFYPPPGPEEDFVFEGFHYADE